MPELAHVAGDLPGLPARDLEPHDVDRYVYVRTAGEAPGLLPGDDGFDDARAALVEELLDSGFYQLPEGDPAPVED